MTLAASETLRPHEECVPVPDAFDAGLWFIGRIRTPWAQRAECPRRGDPVNGPDCRIVLDARWLSALEGVAGKDRMQVLYWMHLSRRDVVRQNPFFGDGSLGTFALRSPLRPNPIASSLVRLLRVEGNVLTVRGLDCIDGTPLVDLKPEFGLLP
ncbi:tRNA-Thr(GGU) m(6)t(6)A37 methyltransferase TsaA [Rhodovulum sulfidophilum]|uniref:SAM-dependent methyltransferase n=1 Tax=Rhodovulum sulfidophilum TaxID=35806 RepID=UPI0005A7F295|nr:SAM-dependent methyltransferase [Rhodovulum sulfidophilum]ANB35203.1 tRNA-Thr(GGU) m(6)t(6)A37 methyltransferase TsaA [Rhodovulum sulfidophilum DSM 1374]ANB39025.1 tRNA-Thr(GGU) m(6)t(6)A37 methyltransferase TsaA [Rhodovulum sulfidophilum]MCW2305541.1 tRNA-Thr(GGU) m(6)t(6)A37 methyltransferase TsaA [Rhodovulum sulfidophilum]